MKKLIIAAAIVCAAAMSQAAAFTWKTQGVKDFAGTGTYSGSATLYVINATTGDIQEYAGTMSGGKMMTGSTVGVVVGDTSAADAGFIVTGTSYSAYYKMTDADGNVFTSTTSTGLSPTYPANLTVNFGNKGTWEAAPEPTSAMLLLLGMAGLALKRRRA